MVSDPIGPEKITIEWKYELAAGGKTLRGFGVGAKGAPNEMNILSVFGWDPVQKKTYYFDFHGSSWKAATWCSTSSVSSGRRESSSRRAVFRTKTRTSA